MLPIEQHYDPDCKKWMLVSAVKQIPELAACRTIDNNRPAAGGSAIDYDAYSDVLMVAAVQRDDNLKLPMSRNMRVV